MSTSLDVGSKAPDFDMATDGGDHVSLSEYAGKTLVLYFYPKDDTSGCTKQAIAFTEHLSTLQKAGADVLGVSKDSVASHEKFVAKHDLGIKLASDESLKTCQAYGVWVEKNMYGRHYMGIERSTFVIGPDGKIAALWRKVRVAGHVEKVLEAVETLAKG